MASSALDLLIDSRRAKREAEQTQAALITKGFESFIKGRQQQRENAIELVKLEQSVGKNNLGDFLKNLDGVKGLAEIGVITPSQARQSISGFLGGTPTQPKDDITSILNDESASQTPRLSDFFATQTTAFGVPKDLKSETGLRREGQINADIEVSKQVAAQEGKEKAKQIRGSQKQIKESSLYFEQFGRSRKELSKIPGIGNIGPSGKGARFLGFIGEKLDLFPETAVLLKDANVSANQQARSVEGGKITDQDRKIYADALVNALGGSDNENARLGSNALRRMHNDGGNIKPEVISLIESGEGPLQQIGAQVMEFLPGLFPEYTFTSEKEARDAGKKNGDVIILGDQVGVIS